MSLKPGQQVHGAVTNPPALATGVIQNPMTPVEYGRTAEKSKYTVADDTGPLPDFANGTSGDASGSLTGLTISGDSTADVGSNVIYRATVTGKNVNTAAGTFLWSASGVSASVAEPTLPTTDIIFEADGSAVVTCVYTENGVTGSPVTGTLNVTVSV